MVHEYAFSWSIIHQMCILLIKSFPNIPNVETNLTEAMHNFHHSGTIVTNATYLKD